MTAPDELHELLSLLFQGHPWHGVDPGPDAPDSLTVFIELVPADTVKYEIDKASGLLRLDRPQRYSSVAPEPYGFIPRTLCGPAVAAIAGRVGGRQGLRGDDDPLDVCVLTERSITHGDVLVRARPIGGLRMFDGEEVDDKIVAVLESDPTYADWHDIDDCPEVMVDRLQHYFLTYKDMPGTGPRRSVLAGTYGAEMAREVVAAAIADYRGRFGNPTARLAAALRPESRGSR